MRPVSLVKRGDPLTFHEGTSRSGPMDTRAPRKRLITVQDVAREAGVSKATAARVLGGYGPDEPDR